MSDWIMKAASFLYVIQMGAFAIFITWDMVFGGRRSRGHCSECERRQRFRDGWPAEGTDYHG